MLGRNIEAYLDDMLVNLVQVKLLVSDLREALECMR